MEMKIDFSGIIIKYNLHKNSQFSFYYNRKCCLTCFHIMATFSASFSQNNLFYPKNFSAGSGDLIRLRNSSKLVERSLFVIIDLLQGAKSILLCYLWRVVG